MNQAKKMMWWYVLCVGAMLLATTAAAEARTISATGEYRMGDNDTRTDAKRLALLDAKRLALEEVGTYVESISEVRNMQLTRDDIRAYTAGIVVAKEVATRGTLEGETMVVRVDVICDIDTEVLTKQIDSLRRRESVSQELTRLQAENEKLRARLTEQSQAVAQAKTKAEAEQLSTQRRETLTDLDVGELVTRAWVSLAGSEDASLASGSSNAARRQEARRFLTQALSLAPDSARAHQTMGILLSEEGDTAGAMRELNYALRIQPNWFQTHYNIALVLQNQGDLEGAAREYRQTLLIRPNDADARNNLGNVLLSQGDIEGALREYREAIRLRPNDAKSHSNLGIALKRSGDIEGAIREYREAVRVQPNFDLAYFNLGLEPAPER